MSLRHKKFKGSKGHVDFVCSAWGCLIVRVFILSLFSSRNQFRVTPGQVYSLPLASSEFRVDTAYHCLSFQHKKPGSSEVLLRHQLQNLCPLFKRVQLH